ncbi:ferredoxin [Desulfonema ishimotonii]|uniref:Ferredoxin n=1 Tax=Desulfonema ishimotonii TaxID=45657 RepID=A0A401G0I6_9BACT|nr:ferredoxin [Desulfonema ishimotonii]GBC62706.1 ferredoxin [Desulfonema ishimotonii]
MKKPVIDHGDCKQCGGCVEVSPSAFACNVLGFVDVLEAGPGGCYPEDEISEAIAICPEDCIAWEEERIQPVRKKPRQPDYRTPVVDYSGCNQCGGCIVISPSVFTCNDSGYIDVADAEPGCYPEDEINEVIAICPGDCIAWDEE